MSAFLLCASGIAFAGDYTVVYAVDTGDANSTGKVETCEYLKPCVIELKSAGLRVLLIFTYPAHDRVSVRVHGQLGCCYFSDGVESVYLDPKDPLHHLAIFSGHARRRNELVQNQKEGVLYLGFQDLK